jgi:hypothetical protein
MADINEQIADFHVRLGRLESSINQVATKKIDSRSENILEFTLALVALGFSYYGIGLPNHYYQYLFGLLLIVCLYHKGAFPMPKDLSEWILVVLNILIASILLKLVIGGGEPRPFSWLSYPTLEGGVTSFKLSWQETNAAKWELPLTVIQSFFLVVTMFGSLIGLSFLSGMTSFVLVLLAVPALIDFNWTYAMPGMIAALACFYLQGE